MAKYEEWLEAEKLLLLEGWARRGLIEEQIAENMGIASSTLREWKKKYSAISAALKKGKEVVDIQVENALLKRALGYEIVEVTEERILPSRQEQRHGGKSELTEKDWQFAFLYFNHQCCYCGIDLKRKPTKDHVIPLAKGGEMEKGNILPCCQTCNSSKKDQPMRKWFEKQSFFDIYRLRKIEDYFQMIAGLEDCRDMQVTVVTKQVTKHIAPDTTAQIFWLKNRRSDLWRDKQTEDTSNLPDIQVDEP